MSLQKNMAILSLICNVGSTSEILERVSSQNMLQFLNAFGVFVSEHGIDSDKEHLK